MRSGKNDLTFPEDLARKYQEDDQRVIEQNQTFEDVEQNRISHPETKYVHMVKTLSMMPGQV